MGSTFNQGFSLQGGVGYSVGSADGVSIWAAEGPGTAASYNRDPCHIPGLCGGGSDEAAIFFIFLLFLGPQPLKKHFCPTPHIFSPQNIRDVQRIAE